MRKPNDDGTTMKALRWLAHILGEVLITIGLLSLLFVAWQLWWTGVTANREQAGTIHALERGFGPAGVPGHRRVAATDASVATLKNIRFGEAFAIVRIPRFGTDYARPVLQSTEHDTLTKGIGHYPGTAMPGQVGNFAVAGHRTTYGQPFDHIDLLQRGDIVVVETRASYIVYSVDRHVIVTPDHVEVIAPVPQHPGVHPSEGWMTMTACHPKYSASERYVVFAKLVKAIPRASGLPASFMAVPPAVG
jgi:sortase A